MIWRRDYDRGIINNISEVRAVVFRAHSAFTAAGQFGPAADVALDPLSLPTDPTLQPGQGQFSYRVVVEVTEGGQRVADAAVTVTANMSLTYDEVRQLAIQTVLSDRPDNRYRNSVGGAMTMERTTDVYVISAARAS
jgi:hypothetical protein